MAETTVSKLVSDEFWEVVQPQLPPEPSRPKVGRPRRANRAVLAGIKARIARRGVESRQSVGRNRWIVERGFSWR